MIACSEARSSDHKDAVTAFLREGRMLRAPSPALDRKTDHA